MLWHIPLRTTGDRCRTCSVIGSKHPWRKQNRNLLLTLEQNSRKLIFGKILISNSQKNSANNSLEQPNVFAHRHAFTLFDWGRPNGGTDWPASGIQVPDLGDPCWQNYKSLSVPPKLGARIWHYRSPKTAEGHHWVHQFCPAWRVLYMIL